MEATITIDLNEIDTDDILNQAAKLIDFGINDLTINQDALRNLIKSLNNSGAHIESLNVESVDDQLKLQLITEVFHKYTLDELTERLS